MTTRQIQEIEKNIKTVTDKIVQDYQPEKIILFGSFAWGKPQENSDIDLFIVKETENTRTTAREIDGSLWGRTVPMDIIVYRPASVQKALENGDFFVRNILTKGRVLYERK